ncbi:MAG: hypothetical protein QXI58_00465 [Candidatus Micrarchaeia archaeon]
MKVLYLKGDTDAGFWRQAEEGYIVKSNRDADKYWDENENGIFVKDG